MKRSLKKLLVSIMAFAVIFSLVSCVGSDNKTVGAIESIQMTNGKLTWSAAENANGYDVLLDNTVLETVTKTEYDIVSKLSVAGSVTVSVRAKKDEAFSEAKSITLKVEKLTAPTVSIKGERFEWEIDPNAFAYSYSLNGSDLWMTTYTNFKEFTVAGDYTICVKSLGKVDGTTVYLTSDSSEISESLTIIEKPILSIDASTSVLIYTEISNANRYDLYLDDELLIENIESNFNLLDNNVFDKTGIYNLTIKAFDGEILIASSISVEFTTPNIEQNEIMNFNNKWAISFASKSSMFEIDYTDEVKAGDYGFSAKFTSQGANNWLKMNLGERYTIEEVLAAKTISYRVYVEKPTGYDKDTFSLLGVPRFSGEVAVLADPDGTATFNEWHKVIAPVSAISGNNGVFDSEFGLILGGVWDTSEAAFGISSDWGKEAFSEYVFYLDDIYLNPVDPNVLDNFNLKTTLTNSLEGTSFDKTIKRGNDGYSLKVDIPASAHEGFFFMNTKSINIGEEQYKKADYISYWIYIGKPKADGVEVAQAKPAVFLVPRLALGALTSIPKVFDENGDEALDIECEKWYEVRAKFPDTWDYSSLGTNTRWFFNNTDSAWSTGTTWGASGFAYTFYLDDFKIAYKVV